MTDFFFIHLKRKFIPVHFDEIIYVLSAGHHIKIVTTKGIYLPHLHLKDIAERLPKERFAQINRATIIALKRISSFDRHTIVVDNISFVLSDQGRRDLVKRNCILMMKDSPKERQYTADTTLVKSSFS